MVDAADRRELYLRAQALVSRVYALPEPEREPFMDRETVAEPKLRDEVRWLLEALTAPDDDFLESPALADVPTESELKVPAPRNYTLIRPLGEGGMGVVYLAERIEGELKQVVALKLLNLIAMLNPMVVSRFLTERQLLAKLNHPNIARLIDAGALSDGRPFLAMEYVEGVELDRYCEMHELGIAERLKLFVKVCQAVQYAHQHLIIHRDLKPANVLVTAEGEPKLVDFGIARLWADTEGATTQTMGVERIMTLAYASPEQLSGKPLSTTTDVYSLGVMLYELLAGERPWGDHADPLTLARQIGESAPVPPSVVRQRTQAVAEAAKRGLKAGWRWRLPRELPRDLDAIVLKALRLKPEERYESAQALAEDLGRFQTNRPVRARQGRTWYWMTKYARRNWVPLTVTAGIVAMTAGYIADRQQQLEKTERERAKVEQVRDFLIGLFREVQPAYTKGENISAREMLDRGAKRLETHPLGDQLTQTSLFLALAQTYRELGDNKGASKLALVAIDRARPLKDDEPALFANALLTGSEIFGDLGDKEHMRLALELKAFADTRKDLDPGLRARALTRLAWGLHQQGKPLSEFGPYYEKAIDQLSIAAPDSEHLLTLISQYANQLTVARRTAEAIPLTERAVKLARKLYAADDPRLLRPQRALGATLYIGGRFGDAEKALRDTVVSMRKVYGAKHRETALTVSYLAIVLLAEGKLEEALELQSERTLLARRDTQPGSRDIIYAIGNMVEILRSMSRFDEARKLADERLTLARATYGSQEPPIDIGHGMIALARINAATGRMEDARAHAQWVLDKLGNSELELRMRSTANVVLGQVSKVSGDQAGAERLFRQAAALDPKGVVVDHQFELGRLMREMGRFQEAESLLNPLLRNAQRNMAPDSPKIEEYRLEMKRLDDARRSS